MSLTTLTGVVEDSDSVAWSLASWVASLQVPGGPAKAVFAATGAPVPISVAGILDASGTFSGTLPDTASILPTGCKWHLTIAPLITAPSQAVAATAVSGGTFDMGAFVSSRITAPRIQSAALVYAYADVEIINMTNGDGYTNTANNSYNIWNGTAWVPIAGGNGTVDSGNTVALAFYPATGTTVAGTAGLSTDSTQQNINVPGVATTKEQVNTGTFSIPSGTVLNPETIIQPEQNNPEFIGPGWNLGNSGGWSVNLGRADVMQTSVRGISQAISPTINKHAIGDTAGVYVHLTSDGGIAAQSDEGISGMTLSVLEPDTYFHGTVSSTTGIGDQAPVLAFASGSGWTSDGAFLLNITKGTISGNMIAASTPISFLDSTGATVTSFLNSLDVGIGGVPVSTKIGVVGNIANPNVTANAPVLVTLSVKLLQVAGTTHAFAVNDVVSVAGDFYPEQSIIQSATTPAGSPLTQTITLKLRNPNTSAFIFCGGIQGQYISFDANLALSGMRSSYYAFGSLTGQDMIYGNNVQGGLTGNTLPRIGFEAATSTAFDPNNGFHLYPGAEVVCNNNQGFDCTLEQNGVHWAVSDVVENPHFPTGGGNTLLITKIQDTPTDPSFQGIGIELALQGAGITGAFSPLRVTNQNNANFYQQDGGPLIAPSFIRLFGSSDSGVIINKAPKSAILLLESFHGTDVVTLIGVPSSGANFQFDPTIGFFVISHLQLGNGVTFGTLNVGGEIQAGGQNGIPATITTAAITPTGTQGSMVFNRGILVAETPAT